jgi:hypothetical protein
VVQLSWLEGGRAASAAGVAIHERIPPPLPFLRTLPVCASFPNLNHLVHFQVLDAVIKSIEMEEMKSYTGGDGGGGLATPAVSLYSMCMGRWLGPPITPLLPLLGTSGRALPGPPAAAEQKLRMKLEKQLERDRKRADRQKWVSLACSPDCAREWLVMLSAVALGSLASPAVHVYTPLRCNAPSPSYICCPAASSTLACPACPFSYLLPILQPD